jgi:tRNA nucleotidyltransferase (CCA-adding enzyme)
MHLILTHEQADFDGIASLLGAALLHPQAVALLPRRMNRNVRSFIDLYGQDLPFTENRDLPNRPIQTITLVDTQSLATPKGMSAATRVNVIDHHPLRPDLPAEWEQSLHELGACTTTFVQALQEKEISLSFVQATLLLLGIYEDTGALTYASTTPQDIRAAADLLERGASLRILANFLNPPLSPEQRSLHDRLLASARSLTLNHHRRRLWGRDDRRNLFHRP